MYKYHCLNNISQNGLKLFKENYQNSESIDDVDCILVRSAKMHDMKIPESVQAIARAGAGVNNIPLDELAQKGVFVFNTPGANANSVKEMVFAGMYLAARDIMGGAKWCVEHAKDENISKDAEAAKKQFAGSELAGKKLGVIGLGAIGVRVATEATHMDMEVYGYDPYISVNAAWHLSRKVQHIEKLEDLVSTCDYISIHVPLIPQTKGMIDEKLVSLMKEDAVLLNYARDALVDEEAVVRALNDNKLRMYVTDFPNPVIAGVDKVLLTPHIGASTGEAEENCAIMAVKEIKDFMENGNARNSVNLPNLDLGPLRNEMRLCILHRNSKGMLAKFTKVLDEASVNVSDMGNTSKGEYAYTMLDLDSKLDDKYIKEIAVIEEVIRIREIG